MYQNPNPTPQVICPYCQGGNPIGAVTCMWCHRALQPKKGMSTLLKTFLILLGVLLVVCVGIIGLLTLIGLNTPVNTLSSGNAAPPSYVKTVSALAEGSKAFQIYFVLADANGQPTGSSGTATLTISQEHTDYLTNKTTTTALYTNSFNVHQSDFQNTTVGQGSFAHQVILCNLGRIPYTNFRQQPSELTGKVTIHFVPTNGAALDGDTTVFFDQ